MQASRGYSEPQLGRPAGFLRRQEPAALFSAVAMARSLPRWTRPGLDTARPSLKRPETAFPEPVWPVCFWSDARASVILADVPDIHHNSEPPPGSDRSPEDRMTAGATAVWIYAELAKSRGISRRSAERLAQRHHWPRRPGNDGTTRVGVPAGAYKPTDRAQGDDRGADQGDAGGVIAALRDAFATALGARDGEICVMSETPTENRSRDCGRSGTALWLTFRLPRSPRPRRTRRSCGRQTPRGGRGGAGRGSGRPGHGE